MTVYFSLQHHVSPSAMISNLDQLESGALSMNKRFRIAVVRADDKSTVRPVIRAVRKGFAEAILIGDINTIKKICRDEKIADRHYSVVDVNNDYMAAKEAVSLAVREEADIVMKGHLGTDILLKAVMDKEDGLMLPDVVLTYVGVMDIPSYHKLLFITDPAVIPYPDLDQKIAMAKYAVEMARTLGIEKPRIALIAPSEKMSRHFSHSSDYAVMCKMAERKQIDNCIMDGPVDISLACDRRSSKIKGVKTHLNGEADILLFPSLESCNPFYKGLMLFAKGKLAGLLRGTRKPVVVMSRSESEQSKYYCISLACMMA
jgi:phosphate butyryltransferase